MMDGSAPITRAEHNEFAKRLEEENRRQDKRIELLERSVREIGALTTSVEKLAMSVESMVKEQAKQGEPLEALGREPGPVLALGHMSSPPPRADSPPRCHYELFAPSVTVNIIFHLR